MLRPFVAATELVSGAHGIGGVNTAVDSNLAPMPTAGHESATTLPVRLALRRGGVVSMAPSVRLSKKTKTFAALGRASRSMRTEPTLFDGVVPCEMMPKDTPLKKNSEVFAALSSFT